MSKNSTKTVILSTLLLLILAATACNPAQLPEIPVTGGGEGEIYLPLITNVSLKMETVRVNAPLINAAQIDGSEIWQMAVFWFGQVGLEENYTDMRVGFYDNGLAVHFNTADRRLWYNEPGDADLTQSDAVTLYLQPAGAPAPLRFDAQLSWASGDRGGYQAAYRRSASGWQPVDISFTSTSGWRGNAPNDGTDDDGWSVLFDIPFDSLGLSGPPAAGEAWRIAAEVHDLDQNSQEARATITWPEKASGDQPSTWSQLFAGIPQYNPPATARQASAVIREGQSGASVPDASVGGYTTCGEGVNKWSEWGSTGESFYSDNLDHNLNFANVQNQSDISDRPCFSRYYVTFPLGAVPPGKTIVSARLRMHQFGNSYPAFAYDSYIQALRVDQDWQEGSIVWNNAPPAVENYGGAWVGVLQDYPVNGVEAVWDVSQAVADSYSEGSPLQLALYSADTAMHSGKYFFTSHYYLPEARPTLEITWGDVAQ